MEDRFYRPTNDYAFKLLFGDENNINLLMNLLNSIICNDNTN